MRRIRPAGPAGAAGAAGTLQANFVKIAAIRVANLTNSG